MTDKIKIAVDAMGGDNSPKKVIDGIIHHHQNNKNVFYKIFGDITDVVKCINNKINVNNFEIVNIIKII